MQPHHRETGGQRMNAQDLKNSILQRAIEGKLVPQRKEEGTARELLAEIRAEKARLIKEKKIKKSKPLPAITDDEKPFDIPENWEWVRLGEIFFLQAGKNIKAAEINVESTESYQYPCYGGNGIRGFVKFFNSEGDFPLIGRQGALCGNINRATGKFYATEHAVLTHTFANTDVSWACYFLTALNLNQYATATAQPGLAVSKINHVLIPLPPLAEQKRIVAKIETLLPDLAAYDDAQTELHTLTHRFPDDMKKSLLQYAIEGKLVPQKADEGTAKDLLREIQTEKARLIKEKKIKKTKPLPAITDDEKPFAIPDSWEWVWLEGLIFHISSKKYQIKQKDINTNGLYPVVSQSMNKIEGYSNDSKKILHLDKPVLVFGDHSRTLKLIDFDFIVGADGTKIMQLINNDFDIRYLYYALRYNINRLSPRNYGRHYSQLSNMPIPVPPLAEQHRIVAQTRRTPAALRAARRRALIATRRTITFHKNKSSPSWLLFFGTRKGARGSFWLFTFSFLSLAQFSETAASG
jgi:type I restriction enzyme S subunit